MHEYFVVDLKHLREDQPYISVWRPDDSGYAWPLSWAGRYSHSKIIDALDYYHNGRDTIAVPCAEMEALAVAPARGRVDGDAGPVVENTAENWRILIDAMLCDTQEKPCPKVKGWKRERRHNQ